MKNTKLHRIKQIFTIKNRLYLKFKVTDPEPEVRRHQKDTQDFTSPFAIQDSDF